MSRLGLRGVGVEKIELCNSYSSCRHIFREGLDPPPPRWGKRQPGVIPLPTTTFSESNLVTPRRDTIEYSLLKTQPRCRPMIIHWGCPLKNTKQYTRRLDVSRSRLLQPRSRGPVRTSLTHAGADPADVHYLETKAKKKQDGTLYRLTILREHPHQNLAATGQHEQTHPCNPAMLTTTNLKKPKINIFYN